MQVLQCEEWLSASEAERMATLAQVAHALGDDFAPLPLPAGVPSARNYLLPQLRHRATGSLWRFIPGGRHSQGLSAHEEQAARKLEDPPPLNLEEMRPCHLVEVQPFIVMQSPVTVALAERVTTRAQLRLRAAFPGNDDVAPAFLLREEAESLAHSLGLELLSESEWEYACRAGTQTLFSFGDALPGRPELERLVQPDLSKAQANPFGLLGMFVGEWCADRFRRTYASASSERGYSVRGGGSLFWPWQGSEWGYCVSAARMPSTDTRDGSCALRLKRSLRTGD